MSGGFAFPFPLGDDAQNQISELMSRADAVHDDTKNRFYGFLEKQSPEDLATLMAMLGWGADEGVGRMRLAHMIGWGEAILRIKYPDVCDDCGRKTCGKSLASLNPGGVVQDPDFKKIIADAHEKLGIEFNPQLEEYGLVRVDDPEFPAPFKCIGCGAPYQSLEDRMRRQPGPAGCPTCVQQTKWG